MYSKEIKTVITNCAKLAYSDLKPGRFVVSMKIMDELKAVGLENSPENNRIVQEKLDKITGYDLPKIGDMIEFDNGGNCDVGGLVEEIDFIYEVVCVNDDYGNACEVPFDQF